MTDEVNDRANKDRASWYNKSGLAIHSRFWSGQRKAIIGLVKVDSTAGANLCDDIVRCLNLLIENVTVNNTGLVMSTCTPTMACKLCSRLVPTRWAARIVNLRIVQRCLAAIEGLSMRTR